MADTPAACGPTADSGSQSNSGTLCSCSSLLPQLQLSTVEELSALVGGQLRLLGRGGCAAVFTATWQSATVAVKLVLSEDASPLMEGPLSKSLRHPCIVECFCWSCCQLTDSELEALSPPRTSAGGACRSGGGMVLPWLTQRSAAAARRDSCGGGAQQLQALPTLLAAADRHSATSGASGAVDSFSTHSFLATFAPFGRFSRIQDETASFTSGDGFGRPYPSVRGYLDYGQALDLVGARPGQVLSQLVLEYCDRGSLAAAVSDGAYATAGTDRAAMYALLRTLRDVASGMAYLHHRGIIHGDLKPGNILLRSSRVDARGYTAKVCDFGLSQQLAPSGGAMCAAAPAASSDGRERSSPLPPQAQQWGTAQYMAPELVDGQIDKASDVWSFGVVMWAMYTGEAPFAGMEPLLVALGVADGTLEALRLPAAAPAALRRLHAACVHRNPARRPGFLVICKALEDLEAKLCC